MVTKTLGGDRLGAGKKMQVNIHGFERSTHDLGHVFRTTMAPGTLVPFLCTVATPADTFDIDLNAQVLTLPTVGPLFASFKLQLDVFQIPMRLYNAVLHNNALGIGMKMNTAYIPQLVLECNPLQWESANDPLEFQQINQSALLAYLGIRGVGQGGNDSEMCPRAYKNAIPLLAYWDIYKNYYANKQEEFGVMIHTELPRRPNILYKVYNASNDPVYSGIGNSNIVGKSAEPNVTGYTLEVQIPLGAPEALPNEITITSYHLYEELNEIKLVSGYTSQQLTNPTTTSTHKVYTGNYISPEPSLPQWILGFNIGAGELIDNEMRYLQRNIQLMDFPLEHIDEMREKILQHPKTSPFFIDPYQGETAGLTPYSALLENIAAPDAFGQIASFANQEGLGIKTYQSDMFNNWIQTEWIDGNNGIAAITAIDTSNGSFTIDTLNLSKKVYDMFNRIAVSGGSYNDWIEVVYDHQPYQIAESPVYMGGLSKEIIFQEVVSQAATEEQPLGTLAGKGRLSEKHKGGKVTVKVGEPSYIMGIVSITPRIDYYQGNNFDTNFKTFDDLHKPNLDEIGFQDLVTDKMAFWDTTIDEAGNPTFKSAGKQPAWLDYMTAVNRLYGNFADERSQMFMTLARRYEPDNEQKTIKDLTTYIDPSKYNYAFAQTDLTAQNFMVQIGMDITARRKMSAKLMPNL